MSEDEGEAEGGAGDSALLAAYAKDPTPGVTLIFEASRYEFEGEDKRKIDRVAKFYASVPTVVELARYAPAQARQEARNLAASAGLRLDDAALDVLVEALAGDVTGIATEIEKLSLYAGDKPVNERDIAQFVPDARAGNIFALVNAMGRRDRSPRAGVPGCAGPRRRISAAGASLSFDSVPYRTGGPRSGFENGGADPVSFFAPGRTDVGFARRTGGPNGGEVR